MVVGGSGVVVGGRSRDRLVFCSRQAQIGLCRFSSSLVKELLVQPGSTVVFLGVERRRPAAQASGEPPAWFAINSTEDPEALPQLSGEKDVFWAHRPNRDLLNLSQDEAGQ